MAGKKTSVIQVMIAGDSSDLQKATRGGASAFGALAGAAVVATKVIASAATAIAGFSIREFAKFDEAMTKSTAIMGDLSDGMRKDMSDAARQVALETTFAADEVAEAFFFLASAGLDAQQSIAALPQVAQFAQAGAFDLATATDLLTDAQSALGLTTDDTAQNMENMARVSDVLAKANTISNATIEEFSQALTEKAGVALQNLGVDIEEGAAALAIFADQGVKGTKAGTLLNTTLEGLTRTADENKDAYDALGVSVFDNEGEMRNLADIVGDLDGAFDGMSTQARNAELRNLGFTRQARDGVLQLLGNADALREYEDELRNAAGTTEEIAEKQLESFNAQLSLLRSGLSDVGISIGQALAGPLGNFVKWFQSQIPAIKAFVEEAIPQVEAFVDRAVAKFGEFKQFYEDNLAEPLGDLMERLRGLAGEGVGFVAEFRERALEFLGDFAQAVADADSEEAGTVLGEAIGDLIVLGFDKVDNFGAFVADWAAQQDWTAIGLAFSKHFGKFVKGLFMGLTHSMNEESGEIEFDGSKVVKILIAGLVARIPLVRNLMNARRGIFAVPIIGSFLRNILTLARGVTPGLGAVAAGLGMAVKAAFLKFFGGTAFVKAMGTVGTAIRLAFSGGLRIVLAQIGGIILTGLKFLITKAFWVGIAKGIGIAAVAAFGSIPAAIIGTIAILIIGLLSFLGAKFPDQIREFINETIPTWVKGAKDSITEFFKGIVNAIRDKVGEWKDKVLGWFSDRIDAVKETFTIAKATFLAIGMAVVSDIIQGVRDKLSDFGSGVLDWFKDRIQDIKDIFNGEIEMFKNLGGSLVDGLSDGVKASTGGLVDAAVGAARDAFNAARNWLDSRSPSRKFAELGDAMGEGMSAGLADTHRMLAAAGVSASRSAFVGAEGALRVTEVPLSADRRGAGDTINITVTSADPQAVVEALRRYTRSNGPLSTTISV